MFKTPSKMSLLFTLMFAANMAQAHYVEGKLFCDTNRSGVIDSGDAPIGGGLIVATHPSGGVYSGETGYGSHPWSGGRYKMSLPREFTLPFTLSIHESTIPSDAVFIVPSTNNMELQLTEDDHYPWRSWLIDSASCHDDVPDSDPGSNQGPPTGPMPEIGVCTHVTVNSDMQSDFLDADTTIGDSCDNVSQAMPEGIVSDTLGTFKLIVTNLGNESLIHGNITAAHFGLDNEPLPSHCDEILVGESCIIEVSNSNAAYQSLSIENVCTSATRVTKQASVAATGKTSGNRVSDNDSASINCVAGSTPNTAPIITSSPITSALIGTPYSYAITVNDPEGDTTVLSLTEALSGMTIDSDSNTLNWVPVSEDVGSHQVKIQVEDTSGLSTTQMYTVVVAFPNRAPQITSTPSTQVDEGLHYTYQPIAADPDYDQLSFALSAAPQGMTMNTDTGLISWLPSYDQSGLHSVTLKVEDPLGLSDRQTFALSVLNVNRLPTVTDQTISLNEDQSKEIILTGSDPDGQVLSFSLVTQASNGILTGDAPNLIYTPNTHFYGSDQFTYSVFDGERNAQATIFIDVLAVNDAPTILSSPSSGSILEGSLFEYPIEANDIDEDTLVYSLVSGPSSVQVNENTGILVWLPQKADLGTHDFSIGVSDGIERATQAFSVTVKALPNTAPIAQSQTLFLDQDQKANVILTGIDANNDDLAFTVIEAPANGSIVGQLPNIQYIPYPGFTGTDSIYFVVSDGEAISQVAEVTISVNPVNHAPEIVSQPPSLAVTQGGTFIYPVEAFDVDNDPLSFSNSSTIANTLISDSGELRIETGDQALGSYEVTVTVSDAEGLSDSQVFELTILSGDVQSLDITSTPGPMAFATNTYEYQIETNQAANTVSYELINNESLAYIAGDTLLWNPETNDMLQQDIKLSMCANYDDFIIGAAGSASVFAESYYDPKRFPKIFKPIHPTLLDILDIDNQITLGAITRDLAGEKWGFENTYSITSTEPGWTGLLTRLIVPEEQGET